MTTSTDAYSGMALPVEESSGEAEVRRLYDHAPIGIAATIVNSLILVGVLRNLIDPLVLVAWWTCLMVVTGARLVHVEWFRRVVAQGEFDPRRWGAYFVGGLAVAGCVWGASSIWIFPESVAHQSFLAFVLGGMVAGAAATFSVRMDAFLAFTVPALAPLALRFFLAGDELHIAMGAMIFLFGLLLTGTAHRVNRLLSRTMMLESSLSHVTKHSDGLNVQLLNAERARSTAERALASHAEDNEERLRQYVADMTDTFVTLQEKSERRLAARFQRELEKVRVEATASFGTGIAYRLEGFLRQVSSQLREGLRDPDVVNTAVARQTLRDVEAAVDAETDFVDELLLLGSRDPNDRTPVDVKELVASKALQWRERLLPTTEVWHSSAKEIPRVVGSPRALAYALEQLLSNAVAAMDSERGTIEIRTHVVTRGELDFAGASPPEAEARYFVAMEVLDDGEGMDAETTRRAFEPFFSTRSRGKGLGLPIVKAIVHRHGGTMSVESHPLRGTSVRLFLPAAPATLH